MKWLRLIFLILSTLILLIGFYYRFSEPDLEWMTNSDLILASPSWGHPFGTDSLGRDLWIRCLFAFQNTLFIGGLSAAIAFTLGLCWGAISVWYPKLGFYVMIRIVDIFLSLPQFILVSVVILGMRQLGVLDEDGFSSLFWISLGLGLSSWMFFSRQCRNLILKEKSKNYVHGAIVSGASSYVIFFRHLLANLFPLLTLNFFLQLPQYFLFEGYLSFIGIGVQPPQTSLGLLIQEGIRVMQYFPHLMFFPSVLFFIMLFTVYLNSKR